MSRGYPIVTPALDVDAQVVDAAWRPFTPQILNNGAGATPNYLTNSGRFMVANNVVRCDILLDGDGGTPGSGAGQLSISLPALPSALRLTGFLDNLGYSLNNANYSKLTETVLRIGKNQSLTGPDLIKFLPNQKFRRSHVASTRASRTAG